MFSTNLSVNYRGRNLYIKNLVGRDFKRNFRGNGKELIFMNFAGGPDKWNPRGGSRYFHINLPRDLAMDMSNDGWKIYDLDNEEYDPYLKININYPKDTPGDYSRNLVNNSPRASVVTNWNYGDDGDANGGDVTELSEEMIATLDYTRIHHAEIGINGWMNNNGNLSAYLNSIIIFVEEDPYIKAINAIRRANDEKEDEPEVPFT